MIPTSVCNKMSLSVRAEAGLNKSFKSENLNQLYANDPYDAEKNPTGYIKLSSADNILCAELIRARFAEHFLSDFDFASLAFYPRPGGELETRKSLAAFANRFCAPGLRNPVDAENLVLVPGVTAASDLLSHSLCDEGDVILTHGPFYYRFPNDFGDRGLVNIESVSTFNANDCSFKLSVDAFEEKWQELQKTGKRVRGVLLVNPRNPDGGFFPLEEIRPLVEWTLKKHEDMFLIADEIYNLVTYEPGFESVQQLFDEDTSLPKERLVWMWGLSKIFSLPGLRVAVIASANHHLLDSIRRSIMYQGLNTITQRIVCRFLDDHDWIERFFRANQNLLKKAKDECVAQVKTYATEGKPIRVVDSQAGFFFLVDFSAFMSERTWEAERALQEQFKAARVLIVPGESIHMKEPGWFRMVFSANCAREIKEGIRRIGQALSQQ